MLAVKGYYNGSKIILEEEPALEKGQEVIVTILDDRKKRSDPLNLEAYMGRGEKMFLGDANDYVKELRSDDRV